MTSVTSLVVAVMDFGILRAVSDLPSLSSSMSTAPMSRTTASTRRPGQDSPLHGDHCGLP